MSFDDVSRLRALADYRVLDTAAEEPFDNITQLTAKIFGTPISLVSLIDEHRQWFKSRHGLEARETPRDVSFCDHAVRSNQTLLVPDTHLDPRFAENPLRTGAPFVEFYAGIPLKTAGGHAIGTLCVIDHRPRALTPAQRATLDALALQAARLIDLRRVVALQSEMLKWALVSASTNFDDFTPPKL